MQKGTHMITLDQASDVIEGALQYARSKSLPPMTVAVLDSGGHLVAFKKEDGSSLLRETIARAKAWGALGMGVGSRSLAPRAAHHPAFFAALTAMSEGNIVPVPGGVLVRCVEGRLVGAVGVSGDVPDNDEACAVKGIEKAGLRADPGAAE
jgi:uncharacterized protein GlcG (DUF336 family)